MKSIESIVVVGSSGAGKTTLVNGVRGYDGIIIPRRHITRPEREGDDKVENTHTNKEEFTRKVNEGLINPYWERPLEGDRIEYYGFDAVAPEDERLRVYSANNAFLRDKNPTVLSVLEKSLVVVAMSGLEFRAERLGVRSPDMSDAERAVRLKDDGMDILGTGAKIEIINTTQLTPEQGQAAMRKIVEKVLSGTKVV